MKPFVSRTVFDNLSEQIIIIDTENYSIVDVNRALLETLKLKRKEVIGKTCYEITHKRATRCAAPDDICPIGEMLKTGKPITVEHTHYDANCNPFYVEVSASPIKDTNGKITYAVHIAKDITERKKAEEAVSKQASLINLSPDAIIVKKLDDTITFWSQGAQSLYGYTKEEAIGRKSRQLLKTKLPKPYEDILNQLSCKGYWSGEKIHQTKSGQKIVVSSRWLATCNVKSKVEEILETNVDITKRKKAEKALRQKEQLLRQSQAIAHVGSWELDLKTNKLTWSDEVFRIFGLKPQEFGASYEAFLDIVHPDDRAAVDLAYSNSVKEQKDGYEIQHKIIRKRTGEVRFVHEKGTNIKDTSGKIVRSIGMVQDVTERTQMQFKLKEYATNLEHLVEERTKQLRDAECLAAIGQTAGMVGHDIRNPLQAIIGDLYMLKSDVEYLQGKNKQSAIVNIEAISQNINYIGKIVADLQDYSKPLKPEPVEVDDLCKVIKQSLSTINVPDNIEEELDCKKDLPPLSLDTTFLKRILVNLVTNAIQAMSKGGKLTVSAYLREGKVLISVQDTGTGIPEELKPKLFTPLLTTKAKGQGFGLPVVKRYTEALGGTISFESEEDKGTKFTITLPMNKQ